MMDCVLPIALPTLILCPFAESKLSVSGLSAIGLAVGSPRFQEY